MAKKQPSMGMDYTFDKTNPAALKWAQKHAGELVTNVTKHTRELIREAVAANLEGEIDDRELPKFIESLIGDSKRAQLIAHNEVMTAANEGQRQLWNQAVKKGLIPKTAKKTWIITPDEKVCPDCEAMDGVTVGLNDEYPNDMGDGPPAHPRCRCTEGIAGYGA